MNTLYLIAYDIPNDRRRTRLHRTLSGFGAWTQYSLFECFLDDKELIMLRSRLKELLDTSEDNVRIYRVCHACQKKTETHGSEPPAENTVYLV